MYNILTVLTYKDFNMKQFKVLSVAMFGVLLLTAFDASAMMRRASRFVPLTSGRSMFTYQNNIYALASERAKNADAIKNALTSGKKVMLVQDGLDKYLIEPNTSRVFAPVMEMSIPAGSDKVVYTKHNPVSITQFSAELPIKLAQDLRPEKETGLWEFNQHVKHYDLPSMTKNSASQISPQIVATPEIVKGLKTFGQYRQELDNELKRIEALKVTIAKELEVDPFAEPLQLESGTLQIESGNTK